MKTAPSDEPAFLTHKNKEWLFIRQPLFKSVGSQELLCWYSLDSLGRRIIIARSFFLSMVVLLIITHYCILRSIERKIAEPVSALRSGIKSMDSKGFLPLNIESNIEEFKTLEDAYNETMSALIELQKTNHKLIAEAAIGHLTTQVTHDLRGPLSSMEAALGELNKTPSTDPNYPTLLNILNLGSKRLKGIADDLLEKHTPKEKQKVLFSLHRVLDELIGEYQSQERCKEVKFEKENFSTAVALYGEPVKLQRAFGNILKNALEAMEFGFRIMGVHTRPTKQKLMAKNGDSSFAIRRPILRRVMGCRRPL